MTESEQPEGEFSAQASTSADPMLGKELREGLQNWTKLLRQFAENYMAVAEAFRPVATQLAEQIKAWSGQIAPFLAQIKEAAGQIAPFLAEIKEAAEHLPPAYRDSLRILGEHGWFLDPEMPLMAPFELSQALGSGEIEKSEQALAAYFELRVDEIERFVAEAHPKRAKVLASAFAAHRAGQFDLSIPVLLAQTDGICRDVAGQYLFMGPRGKEHKDKGHKGKPGMAIYVEEVTSDAFLRALLSPLAEPLPINISEGDRGEGWTALNRHMVLHGESVDYGTTINSLKAISLINYVVAVLKMPRPEAS